MAQRTLKFGEFYVPLLVTIIDKYKHCIDIPSTQLIKFAKYRGTPIVRQVMYAY